MGRLVKALEIFSNTIEFFLIPVYIIYISCLFLLGVNVLTWGEKTYINVR